MNQWTPQRRKQQAEIARRVGSRKRTPAWIAKQRASLKRKWKEDCTYRTAALKQLAAARKNIRPEAISSAGLKSWKDNEQRRLATSKASKYWWKKNRTAALKSLRSRMKKRWSKPGERQRQARVMRKAIKGFWKNNLTARKVQGIRGAEVIARLRKSGRWPIRPSKPQVSLFEMIKAAGIRGFSLEVAVGRYSLDIANRRRKLCVEVDGEYWHALNLTNYEKRDAFLRSRGWSIKRVGTSLKELRKGLVWVLRKVE